MFTPQEIQEQTFSKAVFGGYDMQQVDDFLEPLTEDYITLYKENSVLKAKMKILVEKLEEYRAQETQQASATAEAEAKSAQLLKQKARELAKAKKRTDEMKLFELIETHGPAIIKARHPRAEDVCANVDLYSGFVYEMMGIPRDLYTPLFAIARCVSWCAHRMEELINKGPIIRPAYKPLYKPRKYVLIKDRK